MTPLNLGRWLRAATLLALLLPGCGQTLKITPPKPTKLSKAGAGPALGLDNRSRKQRKTEETEKKQEDPQVKAHRELGELMRQFDDDVRAWRRAYALQESHLLLLESGLTRRAEEEYDTLASAARGDNVPFAMVAAVALSFANRTESVTLLTEIAQSQRDPRIVENALTGLGILAARNPEARAKIDSRMVANFLADTQPSLRVAASLLAMSLVQRGDDRDLFPYLAEHSTDANYMVRANCVWAIGRAAQPGSVALLEVAMMSDPIPEVRCNAALGLAATSDAAAIDVLIAALDDESEPVRRHCVTALALMTGEKFGQSRADWATWWSTHKQGFTARVIDAPQMTGGDAVQPAEASANPPTKSSGAPAPAAAPAVPAAPKTKRPAHAAVPR